MDASESKGFTLMELLIVVAILLIILFLVLINLKTHMKRANDTKRKADIFRIQKAFEEIYNDSRCYPVSTILSTCNGNELSPYVRVVPCDPATRQPYLYVPEAPSACVGYRLCAKLEDTNDPDIARIGCDGVDGCGVAPGYNYCVSAGVTPVFTGNMAGNGSSGASGSTPTATPIPGNFACTKPSQSNPSSCSSYGDTGPDPGGDCPVTFADTNCLGQCNIPSNWCRNY